MTWRLRSTMRSRFRVRFTDADIEANRTLIDRENALFHNPRPDTVTPVADLVRATEPVGGWHSSVSYGDFTRRWPRPFLFDIGPDSEHPGFSSPRRLTRTLCLYDNPGGHFLAGGDDTDSPSRHSNRAALLILLFDPLQERGFFAEIRKTRPGMTAPIADGRTPQDRAFAEAASSILAGSRNGVSTRTSIPVIVAVTKMDLWQTSVAPMSNRDYIVPPAVGERTSTLDPRPIRQRSAEIRSLMNRICPAVVSNAESISTDVTYIGVSALGTSPQPMASTSWQQSMAEEVPTGVCPRDIEPQDAELPLVYGLSLTIPGLFPSR